MKKEFDLNEEKIEEVIETEVEGLTEEEIQGIKDDVNWFDYVTDRLLIERDTLIYWLNMSYIVDSLEELQNEMNVRYEQVMDKWNTCKQKIAPYEDD